VVVAKQLGLGQAALTEVCKWAVFNVVGRNHDDPEPEQICLEAILTLLIEPATRFCFLSCLAGTEFGRSKQINYRADKPIIVSS